jgi:hypothetical protein
MQCMSDTLPILWSDPDAQVDPLAPHPSGRELLEQYRSMQSVEKEVLQVRVLGGFLCAEQQWLTWRHLWLPGGCAGFTDCFR